MNYDIKPADLYQRIIIVGGPQTGKSTLARQLPLEGTPLYCGDPLSKDRQPEPGINYLPEDLEWSAGSQYVADNWFGIDGPWIMEGQIMARALRKYTGEKPPADRIIVLRQHHPLAEVSKGQASMHKGVMKVWDEIADRFSDITEYPTMMV